MRRSVVLAMGALIAWSALACKEPDRSVSDQLRAGAISPATGEERLVTAQVTEARPDALTVAGSDGRRLRLRMNRNTDVLLDGRKADRDELRQGDQVRAAYQGSDDEPLAIRVEAVSGAPRPADQRSAPAGTTR